MEKLILKEVIIQYQQEDDMPVGNTSSYKTDVPLNLTVVVLMGKADSFQWTVNGDVKTGDGQYILIPFNMVSGDLMYYTSTLYLKCV